MKRTSSSRPRARTPVAHAHEARARETTSAIRSRLLRYLYWTVWFVALPTVVACVTAWISARASGAEVAGDLSSILGLARAQPAAIGIVLFAAFETGLWGARHQLPLARYAHAQVRGDLPPQLRRHFQRARSLLDEAEGILARNERALARDLTSEERGRIGSALEALRRSMQVIPFDATAFMDALKRTDADIDMRLGRWRKSAVRECLEVSLVAVVLALALRAFVIEAFKIPSGSMIATLMVGDHIFVNKSSYGPAIPFTRSRMWTSMPPHRADVIVFAFPEQPEIDFIKRVIALPGDVLEVKNGHPIINGWEVPSCRVGTWSYVDNGWNVQRHEGDLYIEYLGDESYLTFYDQGLDTLPEYQGPYFAKPGEVWVMGDNRNNSHDSRMWFAGHGGGVPFENIRGRALFVWLSLSDEGVDWSRQFAPVMGRPRLPPAARSLEPQFEQCLNHRPTPTSPPPR